MGAVFSYSRAGNGAPILAQWFQSLMGAVFSYSLFRSAPVLAAV